MWSGVGVNCAHAPEGLAYPTTCLTRASGSAISPGELFQRLVERFDEALDEWRAGEAFASIRAAWLDCAARSWPAASRLKAAAAKREGVFDGIDADGRLLLRTHRGVETIEAADLRILPAFDAPSARRRPARLRGRGEPR